MSSPTKLRQMAKELGWPPELEKAADQLQKLKRENAELRERLDSVQKSHFTLSKDNAALRELTSTLGAPNHINIPVEKWRELSEDKERLDYMEKNVDFVSWMFGGKHHSWDFRKKIDAKRKEAQP